MSIFDLPGPEFLQLYFGLMIIAAVVGVIWRFTICGFFSKSQAGPRDFDGFEVAYLAGRKKGLGHAVLASLVHRKIASVSGNGTVRLVRPQQSTLFPLEQQVLRAAIPGKSYQVKEICDLINDEPVRQTLESRELIVSSEKRLMATLVPALFIVAVLVVGLTKIGVGLSRERPVGILVGLCAFTMLPLIAFCRPAFRTADGDRALEELRNSNAALETSAKANAMVLSTGDLVLALALWGPAAMGGPELLLLQDALATPIAALGGGVNSQWDGGIGGTCGGGGGGCGGCGGG